MIDNMGRISTDMIGASGRLPYWRDVVCATFVELDCESAVPAGFFGSIENRAMLDLQFSDIRSAAQRVIRNRAKIARSDRDYFLLSLQTAGRGIVAQDGRVAVLHPGDFALYDTTRPYDLTFAEEFGQIVLRLPRAAVTKRLAEARQLTALRVPGDRGIGKLASAFLRQVHGELGHFETTSMERVHASTVDLLTTALAEQACSRRVSQQDPKGVLRHRVEAYIDRELADPNLTCESVAAAQGVSARYLRKLFQDEESSLSELIWRRRLDHAYRRLSDPRCNGISVTTIGFDSGFKDVAHFSRAFRSRFGVTPRELRARAGERD